jgi:hypothetical protein
MSLVSFCPGRSRGKSPATSPTNMATTSFASVRIEADRVGGRRCTTPGAMIDTPPQPFYTRAYLLLRTVSVSERRFLCVPNTLTGGRGDASWGE